MEKTFLQVRTDKSDKEKASDILESLGTNLSSMVNIEYSEVAEPPLLLSVGIFKYVVKADYHDQKHSV